MPSATTDSVSFAPVEYWDTENVFVRCPFCKRTHRHGFTGDYTQNTRVPHCGILNSGNYQFQFPFDGVAGFSNYEIDKLAGFFVRLGSVVPRQEATEVEDLFQGLEIGTNEEPKTGKWSDATEMITYGLEDRVFQRLHAYFGGDETVTTKRLGYVISRMVGSGDEDYVKAYLESSPEAELFLHGTDEEGNTALILAACERYPAVVKLLLEHGSDVDHQNALGKSALMEAALWARTDSVRYLLEFKANKHLKDKKKRKAIDLAEEAEHNKEERHHRAGRIYREIVYEADIQRRVIMELLRDARPESRTRPSTHEESFEAYSFQSTDRRTIRMLGPVAEYSVPNSGKTIATLQRPHPYPRIAAMSGWSHQDDLDTVSGRVWSDEVMQLAEIIQYQLQADSRLDQGMGGRYVACHAEKQLIAYFISRHVLVGTEGDNLLQSVAPPVMLRRATILSTGAGTPDH